METNCGQLYRFFTRYLKSKLLPSLVAFCCMLVFFLIYLPGWRPPLYLIYVILFLIAIALLGVLSAGVINLVKRSWLTAFLNIVMLFILVGVFVFEFLFLMVSVPNEMETKSTSYHFNLPSSMNFLEPEDWEVIDGYYVTDNLLNDLKVTPISAEDKDSSVSPRLNSLVNIQPNMHDAIFRYFSFSPEWRVFDSGEKRYAVKRWGEDGIWQYKDNGYFVEKVAKPNAQISSIDFQTRIDVSYEGKALFKTSKESTVIKNFEDKDVILSKKRNLFQSRCFVNANGFIVNIFEQSRYRKRIITQKSLDYLEQMLLPLSSITPNKVDEYIYSQPFSVNSDVKFAIKKSNHPGMYETEIWVNPGEEGALYLKAFEVTKEMPLSEQSLFASTNERVGWSNNPNQLFYSNSQLFIDEGDGGNPYAARFEVWFMPDSNLSKERKIIEKVYKIEGWQR